ncbi:MAG TPA: flagellar biosynthesis protein [Rhodanobacter sp.]|jgi:flagellar biosynthesis protein
MNSVPPPAQRRVTLRLANGETQLNAMPAEALEALLARARTLGVPVHHDPQIAALLVALRMRDDVPVLLYAAAASVLAAVYDAAEE